jgi:hypothetical protein
MHIHEDMDIFLKTLLINFKKLNNNTLNILIYVESTY